MTFKEFMNAKESTPATRRAMGVYPPQPSDIYANPPYSKERFCQKSKGVAFQNLDIGSICKKKRKKKKKRS